MIEITIDDHEVKAAMERLMQRISDMSPVMHDIGETIVERTKQRFAGSKAPDGTPWAPNAPATIEAYLRKFGGTRRKDGSLSKRGQRMAADKKPLIGETKSLSSTIYYTASTRSVTIGSPMRYAAIHQFGGQAGRGHKAPIPQRPFLPINQSGQWIGNEDRQAVLQLVADYLLA